MRAFQGVTIKTKECFETLTWIWFCLSNAREFTGITRKFSILGLMAPALWTKSRKGLRNLVLWVWICSLHFSPPVFKWLLFKNIHNTLNFGVVRIISTAHFIKNSISSLKGLFFCLKEKNLKNEVSHLWKTNCFSTLWWGYRYLLIIYDHLNLLPDFLGIVQIQR